MEEAELNALQITDTASGNGNRKTKKQKVFDDTKPVESKIAPQFIQVRLLCIYIIFSSFHLFIALSLYSMLCFNRYFLMTILKETMHILWM